MLVAAAVVAGLVLTAPRWSHGTGWADRLRLPFATGCVVGDGEDEVRLTMEQAQRATTAVVLAERGLPGPDLADLDPAAVQLLARGPADDAGPVLTCRALPAAELAEEEISGSGLTPRAQRLLTEMGEVFGEQSLGGFAPGGVESGHGAESTHYDGRAVDVFHRPVSRQNRRNGWLLAHWLVAHAQDLHVQYVIFDDRYWGVRSSARGWLDYAAPDPGNEVLRHLDHVHVDVLRGG